MPWSLVVVTWRLLAVWQNNIHIKKNKMAEHNDKSLLTHMAYDFKKGDEFVMIEMAQDYCAHIDWDDDQSLKTLIDDCHNELADILSHFDKSTMEMDGLSLLLAENDRHIQLAILHALRMYLVSADSTFKALAKRGVQLDKLSSVPEKMVEYQADKAMLNMDSTLDFNAKIDKAIELEQQMNDFRNVIFSHIVTSEWKSGEDVRAFQEVLAASSVDLVTSELMVSALTISCMNFFDHLKFGLLLSMATQEPSLHLRARAMVGVLLCAVRVPQYYVPEIRQQIKDTLKASPASLKHLVALCKVFLCAVDNKKANKYFHDRMLDQMEQMVSRIAHDGSDGYDPEYMDRVLNSEEDNESGMSESVVDDMMEMLRSGSDFYFDQFKSEKSYGFFHSMCNWFEPFSFDSVPFLALLKFVGKENEERLKLFFKGLTMCDNDRYSLALVLAKSNTRKHVIDTLVPQEVLDDYKKQHEEDEITEDDFQWDDKYPEDNMRVLVNYVQCLLRFFKLSPMRNSCFNPFGEDGSYYDNIPFLSDVFKDSFYDKARLSVARYCVKKGQLNYVVNLLGDNYPDTIECHYMLAAAYNFMKEAKSYVVLPHVDRLLQDDPANMIFVGLAVQIYEYMGLFDKSIDCLKVFLDKNEDEEKLLWGKRLLADALMRTEDYKGASKLYYELWYKNSEDGWNLVRLVKSILYHKSCSKEDLVKCGEMLAKFIKEDEERARADLDFSKLDPANPVKSLANLFTMVSKVKKTDNELSCQLNVLMGMIAAAYGRYDVSRKAFTTAYESKCGVDDKKCKVLGLRLVDDKQKEWLEARGISESFVMLAVTSAMSKFDAFVKSTKEMLNGLKDSDSSANANMDGIDDEEHSSDSSSDTDD